MIDPFLTLGIHETVSDADVKAAYHRKLRQFPPEEHPERFARISEAYEQIRTEADRATHRLLGPVPRQADLAELAEMEELPAPPLAMEPWIKLSIKNWLTRSFE